MAFKFNPFTGTLDIDEGVSDGDKGDITVSGDTWTIDANAVDFSKMQNIAAYKLIGRHTAGSGDPQQVGIDGGLEFQGANIRRSALTGDVTANAGSNSTTIPATTISGKTLLAPLVGTEEILINDSGVLKKTTSQDIANLSGGGGSGDVVGPASNSLDSNIPLFSGTTGKLLKDSTVPMLFPTVNALHIGRSSTLSAVDESTTYGNNITNTTAGAVVIGYNANNSGAMTIGRNSVVSGPQSMNIGDGGQATGNFSLNFGTSGQATGAASVHFGYAGKARGANSYVFSAASCEAYTNDLMMGLYTRGTSTSYTGSTGIGSGPLLRTIASTQSTMINTQLATSATRCVVIGVNCQSSAGSSVVAGYLCTLTNGYANLGYQNNFNSVAGVVIGGNNTFSAGGQYHVIIGTSNTETSGNYKFIFGHTVTSSTHGSIFCVGRTITVYESNTAMIGGVHSPINKMFLGTGQKSNTTHSDCYYSLTSPTGAVNTAGKNLYIAGSGSTGTANGGEIKLAVVLGTSASGTTENSTLTQVFSATKTGVNINPDYNSAIDFFINGAGTNQMTWYDVSGSYVEHAIDSTYWFDSDYNILSVHEYGGRVYVAAPSSGPTTGNMPNGTYTVTVNEATHVATFTYKYSDGTIKTGTLALA